MVISFGLNDLSGLFTYLRFSFDNGENDEKTTHYDSVVSYVYDCAGK